MDIPNDPIPVGTYVELKDGVDPAFYAGFARIGNKGWIRKVRRDKYKFPQVWIEWDHHDWSYNGAPDGWTWSNHFTPVENAIMDEMNTPNKKPRKKGKTADPKKAITEATEALVKTVFAAAGIEDPSEEQSQLPEAEPENNYAEAIEALTEALHGSRAFIGIVLTQEDSGMVVPVIFQESEDPECALIVQSQLAHVAMMCHDNLIGGAIQELRQEQVEES